MSKHKYSALLFLALSFFILGGCATPTNTQSHNPFNNNAVPPAAQSSTTAPVATGSTVPPQTPEPLPKPIINTTIAPAPTPTPEPLPTGSNTKIVYPGNSGQVPDGSITDKGTIKESPQDPKTLTKNEKIQTTEYNGSDPNGSSITPVSADLPKKEKGNILPTLPKKQEKKDLKEDKDNSNFGSYAQDGKSAFVNTGQEKEKKKGPAELPAHESPKNFSGNPLPTLPKKEDNKKKEGQSNAVNSEDPSHQTFSAPVHKNSLEPVRPMMIPVSSQSSRALLPEPAKLREVHFRTIVE